MASMQTYPEEFKIEAVKQIAERRHRVADVFVRIGVSLHCLYKWITVYLAPAAERQAQLSQAEELRRLRTGAAARDGEARYLEKWATPGSTGRCNTFGGTMLRILGTGVMSSMLAVTAIHAQVGYLGPAGSWTHQACIDLYGEQSLVAYDKDSLMAAFSQGKLDKFCIPVTTSVVGVTPYMDEVLALKEATIVAEYPKMLGYSLLVKPGTTREQVKTVLAHPVALEEVRPWLDKEMPTVERKPAVTGGAASQEVARAVGSDLASMGPPAAARIYGLVALVDGIEEGPHNVTRWWVIGRQAPAPTGRDKTTLLLSTSDGSFGKSMKSLLSVTDQVLTVYERPGKKTLDTHSYVVEVAGHASQEPLKGFLTSHSEFRLLGSYPRRY